MRLPRDIDGIVLIAKLESLGWYECTRQTGSHVRLTKTSGKKHNVTIPLHSPLRIGTLSSILNDISANSELSKKELMEILFK